MFLDAKRNILLKHTSGCGPPCPQLVFQQSLFERGLCGAAPSQPRRTPPPQPTHVAVGRGSAVQAHLHAQDLQRQRNMFQLTAEPGKPGSPGSPCKESGDKLPW